jgi:hypothetical protein
MTPKQFVQRNPYKGILPRCWVRLRFAAVDGSNHERELLADTGCPYAVILGQADLSLLLRAMATGVNTNFGYLDSGWIEINMPELGLANQILGYGNDTVWQAVQRDSADFAGLVGLPLLRMLEYGGDNSSFWVNKQSGLP